MPPLLANQLIPVFILLIALATSSAYFAELRATFPGSWVEQPFCGVDAQAHHARALGIMAGQYPGQNPWLFIPLYPLFLAWLYQGLGLNFFLPVLFQSLLNLVTCAALYAMGRQLFSRTVAGLASLALAVYPPLLYYMACFDQSLLTLPSMTLAIFFLLKYQTHRQLLWLVPAGLLVGLSSLSRPTILILLPAVILWLFWQTLIWKTLRVSETLRVWATSLQQAVLPALCFSLFTLAALLPITWHNYQLGGSLFLVKSGGVNLFTGNNSDASGLDSMALAQSQPAALRNIELQDRRKSGQTSYTVEVLNYIREQPGDWLELTARKFWFWFGETDQPLVTPFFPLTMADSPLLGRLPFEWQATMLAAFLGLVLAPSRNRPASRLIWLIYGLFSLATIIFFIELRFRLPFAPIVLLYAMALAAQGGNWAQHAPWRFWAVLLILLLAYLFLPGLWIFILIFAGLGLGPACRPGGSTIKRWAMTAIWSYLVLGGFWFHIQAANDVSQTTAHYLGPRLAGPGILGQTLEMDCNGFNRLAIQLGTFDDQHDQPVIFSLATTPAAEAVLFSQQFDGREVRDQQWQEFSFGPLPDSQGRSYFFFIASPTSTPENSLTARGYTDVPVDLYKGGRAYAGALRSLQPVQADFAFVATCEQSFWQKLQAGISRMAAGRRWGIAQAGFYWGVLILHLVLLSVAVTSLLWRLATRHRSVPN